jgi:hypothetical protein
MGPSLSRAGRRVLFAIAVTWLPLLLLSALDGSLMGGALAFLPDIETHARLLVALPILILAEVLVHRELGPVLGQFLSRGLVPPEARAQFHLSLEKARKLRDSWLAEVILLLLVVTVGQYVWRHAIALDQATWYSTGTGEPARLTRAGQWFALVSLPLFQFIFLRWYFRALICYQLFWRISRLPLRLQPTHPDRTGGLAFITAGVNALAPILLAEGVMLAGFIATRILGTGQSLLDFKDDILGLVLLLEVIFLGPLVMFTPHLVKARRRGLQTFGGLVREYIKEFDAKWLDGPGPTNEPLLGSADIQSLSDVGQTYNVVRGMRIVPFDLDTVLRLILIVVLPLLPLILTLVSLNTVIDWAIGRAL